MNDLQFYSTNLEAEKVNFHQALLKGLAPDKGLYMPESIPQLTTEEIASFSTLSYSEIAYQVSKKFLGDLIPDNELKAIAADAYNYEVPLEKVYDKKYVLRLDQGPTASFKDFAARMMGRWMQYFLHLEKRNLLILTATSGDTGSAIASAFYGLDNIKVTILYPEQEVTERQRKQMTTLDKNIHIVALKGKFDDCQAMVKQAFADPDLDVFNLSSANSINIGRLLPQAMYYIYTYSRLCNVTKGEEIIFSVPSGNFGNLMGGLIAKHMGLPIKRFVVSTNENDEVPIYFDTQEYKPIVPSKACISSAMNVGHPSNLARIVALYGGAMDEKGNISKQPDIEKMRSHMFATSISDETTKTTIKKVYDRHQVLLEPHGAVSWEGLCRYLDYDKDNNSPEQVCVSLETAHPAKFPQEVSDVLNVDPDLPDSLKNLDGKEEKYITLDNDYPSFKNYIQNNY